MICVEDLFML